MSYENIKYDKKDQIATITIDRPKVLNALNMQTMEELRQAFTAARDDKDVRVVILTGAGEKSFVAGADINELAKHNAVEGKEYTHQGQSVLDLIENLGKPVICCINGFALGGGCELALACDFRVASDTARFGLPEIKIGAFPGGGGTQRLTRLIGTAKAKEMILFGDPITAQEAQTIGLVTKVTAKDKYFDEAMNLAARLAALPRLALQASKMLINRSQDIDLATGLEFEARTFGGIAHSHDLAEGTQAFLEKRKANFIGS